MHPESCREFAEDTALAIDHLFMEVRRHLHHAPPDGSPSSDAPTGRLDAALRSLERAGKSASDLRSYAARNPAFAPEPVPAQLVLTIADELRRVLDPLAMRVLQGEFREGDLVRIDVAAGDLQFSRLEQGVTA